MAFFTKPHPQKRCFATERTSALTKESAPTFVTVSPDDKTLYAACNYGNSVQVWDVKMLT